MTALTRQQVRVSRRISMLLRHRPEQAGLTLDPHGWTPVAVLRVAAGEMAAAGHVFHRTDNGVWLTAVVPPGYLADDHP
ncbi:RNA 2'-phosphotransferase [Krasilnikovia sp. MM14-A1004]|uniref:RNA 2'-phosphotransferase n=1 Tax=Krasilnikovia sp. MM14-A1004 TaxID=3373541 RepID=UPI00399C87BE